MNLYKVKDHDHLAKDMSSGAVLLTNHSRANEYLAKRKAIEQSMAMEKEINTIKNRLAGLEKLQDDVSDIKSLLQQIASSNNGKQ
mgnify:CR=1 FL=1